MKEDAVSTPLTPADEQATPDVEAMLSQAIQAFARTHDKWLAARDAYIRASDVTTEAARAEMEALSAVKRDAATLGAWMLRLGPEDVLAHAGRYYVPTRDGSGKPSVRLMTHVSLIELAERVEKAEKGGKA